jgi:DNA-binding NtrC family response regulator
METVLIVESDPIEALTLMSHLSGAFKPLICPDTAGAVEAVRRHSPSAVLIDFGNSIDAHHDIIRRVSAESRGAPVIALAAKAEPADIVLAMRAGAWDYLRKPSPPDLLRRAVHGAVSPERARAKKLCTSGGGHFIGRCPVSLAVEKRLHLYAASNYPVLIIGESGTGKEVAARALHELSARKEGPFVARNCAAIPDLLAESELFGTERGAFTDAVARPGAFELARGGLLFLDEIGDAAIQLQAKLLRVLETGEFWRLGGRTSVAADFRFVSATCRDLKRAADEGLFRRDLLYRIDTLVLELPPLRERREDIPDLASHFVLQATHGRAVLSQNALEKLSNYEWPGNVRQLRNVVHRAVVLAGRLDEIGPEHIEF